MARNESFNERWASSPAQFERPEDPLIRRGWAGGAGEDPPEAKWENWWHNRVDEALAEIERYGALRWFSDVPYAAGAAALHGGKHWIALVANEGVEPGGASNEGHWINRSLLDVIDLNQNIAVFDTPGVTEWTVPEVLRLGLRKAYVIAVGSGGGGGGPTATSSGNMSVTGGGAAAGWAAGLLDLSGVSSVSVTVAEGGAAGIGGTSNPGDGSTSSFGTYLSATGGSGGRTVTAGSSATFAGSGSAPGNGVGGDIRGVGEPGMLGARLTGNDGYSGHGGSSLLAGGGPGRQSLGNGSNGSKGSGGGGGLSFNGAGAQNGGKGGDGIIIVRW